PYVGAFVISIAAQPFNLFNCKAGRLFNRFVLFDYYGLSKFIAIISFIFSILFYTGKDS
ncbi:MAG: hypothetical protein H6Q24_1078, partial [Bacteroidetes bacterium]|nr:hypothetical protein [Bacteroidota bacterium]